MATIQPTNQDAFAIVRLYLENYSTLAEEDRLLYRKILCQIMNPPFVVTQAERETAERETAEREYFDGRTMREIHDAARKDQESRYELARKEPAAGSGQQMRSAIAAAREQQRL